MNIIGIIPARMESTRFPGKPMAEILGMPMIGHVYHRCIMSKSLDEVYVATCNREIYNYINSIGGNSIMTSNSHERASDRASEALIKIEKSLNKKFDIVVMLQGDEPMTTPEMIDVAVDPLISDPNIVVTNLMSRINTREECKDPNEIKVVIDENKYALYFSREAIPSNKKYKNEINSYKQVCVIPFKRDFLIKYNQLTPTPLEIIESIDMNRILEHGYKVKMVEIKEDTLAVDTKVDLDSVIKKMKSDKLLNLYNNS